MVLNGEKVRPSPVRTVLATVIFVLLSGGLWYVGQVFLGDQILELATNVVLTFVLLGAIFGTMRAVGDTLVLFERKGVFTPHQSEVLYRFIQILMYGGVLLVIIIHVWDVSVTNVILGASVTSVVIALAARQTLSSVFAGINLISTDVFRVGDWVKIDKRFGQIEQISLFNTMMRSSQGEIHVIPNDEVITRDITNLGKNKYRNDVLVGIDYETDIDHATAVCDSILEDLTADEMNNIDGYHPTTVKDFDDSQITIAVKMWVEEPRPMAINQAQTTVLSHVQQQFDAEQITIPFPQRTVSDR